MKHLAELPRTIMPAEFFTLVQRALEEHDLPDAATADRLVVHLSGPGGGAWNLGFEGGRLAVAEGAVAGAPAQLSLSVADWREFVAGRVRDAVTSSLDLGMLDPRLLGQLYASPQRVETLKQFAGDLKVVVEDADEDAEYAATVTLGGGAPSTDAPTTTVRLGLADLASMVKGKEPIQQAFFAGKVRLEGDMNLAMGLMAAMMAR